MWLVVSLLYAAISLVPLIRYLRLVSCTPLSLLAGIIWLRFALATQYEYTFEPIVAGMSINAVSSILVAALGVTLVIPRYLTLRYLLPTYLFVIWIVLSGIINHSTIPLFNVLTKWLYFLTLASLLYEAVKQTGLENSVKAILWVFALPLGLQVLSFALGEVKASEGDGSASYIGGYGHEGVFSVMVLTFFACSSLLKSTRLKGATVGLASLFAANYRTSIIASAPLVLYSFGSAFVSRLESKWRLPGVIAGGVLCTLVVVGVAGESLLERFADIGTVATSWQELYKPAYYYTSQEKDIFSARVYLWSLYLTEFASADLTQQLFGFGPEGWENSQPKYAHNTFVSMLYEYGYFGLLIFLFMMVSNALFALKAGKMCINLLVLHLSFFILNLSTMPMWQIEGLIFYAIINAITWSQCNQTEYWRKPAEAH